MKNKEMLFSKASKLAPILVSFVINEIRFVDVDFNPDYVRVSISRTTNSRVLPSLQKHDRSDPLQCKDS